MIILLYYEILLCISLLVRQNVRHSFFLRSTRLMIQGCVGLVRLTSSLTRTPEIVNNKDKGMLPPNPCYYLRFSWYPSNEKRAWSFYVRTPQDWRAKQTDTSWVLSTPIHAFMKNDVARRRIPNRALKTLACFNQIMQNLQIKIAAISFRVYIKIS